MVLQRVHDLCEQGLDFEAAMAEVRRTTAFTTHTPVAAGHDAFAFEMVETHLAGLWGDLGPNREKFLELGHFDNGEGPQFNMTALALRSAGSVNGVSQLHGEVTKQMWRSIWPEKPADKLPVRFVTNGVHVPTWLSADMARLLEKYLGRRLDGSSRRSGGVRSRAEHPGRGAVGHQGARCAATCSSSCASARDSGGPPRAAPRRAWWRPARCSTRAR